MTAFDCFLDTELERYYEDEEFVNSLYPDDEPSVEPNNDYANYDGWDDMQ